MQTVAEEAAVRREAVPMSVLIVDDEQTVRETCAAVAAQSGMKTIAVATAEEALEVLEHSAVDILLTDLKLPRANGVELLRLVHDLHPEVAVGIRVNVAQSQEEAKMQEAGIDPLAARDEDEEAMPAAPAAPAEEEPSAA